MRSNWKAAAATVLLVMALSVSNAAIRGLAYKFAPPDIPRASYVNTTGHFLGPLRPILVDVLWLRAIDAEDSQRYYEAYGLLYTILELEPRYTPVWVLAGYILAYNISWDEIQPEDRYRWIMNGIGLMEEGIKRNPKNLDVYKQLAHTYAHRLSVAGGDPYEDYFEEYMSPPGEWVENMGFRYGGDTLVLSNKAEYRLYMKEVKAGQVTLGSYPPPGSERPALPYAVLWKPDTTLEEEPNALAKLVKGGRLWVGQMPVVEKYPEKVNGAYMFLLSPEKTFNGVTVDVPSDGELYIAFPRYWMEPLRKAAEVMVAARKIGPFTDFGMDGLNLGRELAHTYRRMGQFIEAEQVWMELLDGVPMAFRQGLEEGVRNFYKWVIGYYERTGNREEVALWTRKMEAAQSRMLILGSKEALRGEQHE